MWITLALVQPVFACEYVNVIGDGQAKVKWCLTLARTHVEQRQGLQGVTTLKPNTGMLFIYEKPEWQYFWMKDTPLALDLIFATSSGIISKIIKNARPFDESILAGGCAQFVIEVEAGAAAKIEPGDRLVFQSKSIATGDKHGKKNDYCM